ncbi:hypothetical protein [Bacillus cereus]
MEFRELKAYIEKNKKEHFNELIKKNENAIKEIDKKSEKETDF